VCQCVTACHWQSPGTAADGHGCVGPARLARPGRGGSSQPESQPKQYLNSSFPLAVTAPGAGAGPPAAPPGGRRLRVGPASARRRALEGRGPRPAVGLGGLLRRGFMVGLNPHESWLLSAIQLEDGTSFGISQPFHLSDSELTGVCPYLIAVGCPTIPRDAAAVLKFYYRL
jgi:hypothetical protein